MSNSSKETFNKPPLVVSKVVRCDTNGEIAVVQGNLAKPKNPCNIWNCVYQGLTDCGFSKAASYSRLTDGKALPVSVGENTCPNGVKTVTGGHR